MRRKYSILSVFIVSMVGLFLLVLYTQKNREAISRGVSEGVSDIRIDSCSGNMKCGEGSCLHCMDPEGNLKLELRTDEFNDENAEEIVPLDTVSGGVLDKSQNDDVKFGEKKINEGTISR